MKCDYCAESIPDDAEECPSCGESLIEGDYEQGGSSALKIVLIVVVVVFGLGVCAIGLLATLMMPALMKAKEKANRTKCANNLRQNALGAIMYSDDKRFFPHVLDQDVLDGDYTTNHTPKKARALVYYGYLDNPEAFVCPSSFDLWIPNPSSGKSWFWMGGSSPDPDLSPFVDGDDPALEECDELSYGWSRRGYNTNVRSTALLAADRSVRTDDEAAISNTMETGNHQAGRNVVRADASAQWIPFPDDGTLVQTEGPRAGYLDILDQ